MFSKDQIKIVIFYKYKTDAKVALICTVFSPLRIKLRVTQVNQVVVEKF